MIKKVLDSIKKGVEKIPYYKFVLPFLIVCIIFIIGIFNNMTFSDFVLLVTFGALLWYSFETRELKISSQLNNELEQKPVVDVVYGTRPQYHNRYYFILKNSGKGTAYNIKITPIKFLDNYKFIFYLIDENLTLFPLGDEKSLEMAYEHLEENGKWVRQKVGDEAQNFFNSLIGVHKLNDKIEFIISYKNANGKNYKRFFRFCEHNIKELSFEIVFEWEAVD